VAPDSEHRLRDAEIVVVAPKFDEALPIGRVFGVCMDEAADLQINDQYATWLFELGGRPCALVVMNGQGSLATRDATSAILRCCSPNLVCLVGTALGRRDSVQHSDVVLASHVIDATEGFPSEIRPKHFLPSSAVRQDLARFEAGGHGAAIRADLVSLCADDQTGCLPKKEPSVHVEPLAVVPKVVKADAEQILLWQLHPKVCAADMESAGFQSAVAASLTEHWVVVRGVSDFGDDKAGKEKCRYVAALAAGVALNLFLSSSIHEVEATLARRLERVCCFFPECDVEYVGVVDGESYSLLYPFVSFVGSPRAALLCDVHYQHAARMKMQDNPETLELWAKNAAGRVGTTRYTYIQDILKDAIGSRLASRSGFGSEA